MQNRAILFITDAGFLVPTMSAAVQAASQAGVVEIADILIMLIDIETEIIAALKDTFSKYPFEFIYVPSTIYTLSDDVHFNSTGVPVSTLARLSIAPLIPEQYEHITYLDGDIQILGDITPLVAHDTAPGKIASANDAMWLLGKDRSTFRKNSESYMKGLGIFDPFDYFNAGVMLFRRATWIGASQSAKQFFLENSKFCDYHDQSALNKTFLGNREIISPKYNFITNYADIGAARVFSPTIVHFTGAGKPWFFGGAPWHGRFIQHYSDFLQNFPMLKPFFKTPAPEKIDALSRSFARTRRIALLRTPWRFPLRRSRFKRYLRTANFVVS